ncbi:hypothetical protein A6769_10135 [Nostoc punctiforme NIES-2108]|uniref:CopG family transcriptional regulator n=1 Tax=Nostoc punctiforme NIES-2108 TaxID=1356359 RepID=A0A367RS33_NOSPU|nr:hypothetical protein A6769_10135 [Nostoc punctiforme NIES-2108]
MGRQKLPSGEQREVKTTFRMTEAESEALRWHADRFGLTVSEFIRIQLAPVAMEVMGGQDNV